MILDKIKIMNATNILKLIIAVIISLGLIYYSLQEFDYRLFLQSISQANYIYISIAVFILIVTIQIRAIRWKIILNQSILGNDLYIAQLIGYMGNNLLPLRFGEFLKSFYLEKKIKISKYEAFGSIVLDDIISMNIDIVKIQTNAPGALLQSPNIGNVSGTTGNPLLYGLIDGPTGGIQGCPQFDAQNTAT